MTVLLGGRMAEQIVFGEVTTGASDDLQRVAVVARAMVYDYAMGTPGTAQRAISPGDADSEQFRRVRDEEQHELAFEAQRAAHQLLSSQRGKLEEFAVALLEHEILERRDIDAIMQGVPRMQRNAGQRGLRVVAAVATESHAAPGNARTSGPPPAG
jgi:cell division protease FtsH